MGGRAGRAVRIRARELDPGAALVDEPAQDGVRRMVDARGQRGVAEVVEHQLRRQAPQQVRELDDLPALYVELHVPAEIHDAFRERLDLFDLDDPGGRVPQGEADPPYPA